MKKYLIAFVAVLCCTTTAFADEVSAKDFTLKQGATADVEIELTNTEAYIAFQMDILLPEGFTVATDEEGEAIIVNGSRLPSGFSITCSTIKGGVRIVGVSPNTAPFTGTSGPLFTLRLQADRSVAAGQTYEVEITEQHFTTDASARNVQLDDASFNIIVESSAQSGDVNSDGSVTIADVTALVNIILGKDDGPNPMYDHEVADVNGDDKVTIADVTALVNKILGKK